MIDSASSILFGFKVAVKLAGYNLRIPLDNSLIGPPLMSALQKLTGEGDESKLQIIATEFKLYYDSEGYKKSFPYAGVSDLLQSIKESKYRLILATNKRIRPTLSILKYFGWAQLFDFVYAIDKDPRGVYSNKSEMLMRLIEEESIERGGSLYVGDRLEDQLAAQQNGLSSITVGWGYGDYQDWAVYSLSLIHI